MCSRLTVNPTSGSLDYGSLCLGVLFFPNLQLKVISLKRLLYYSIKLVLLYKDYSIKLVLPVPFPTLQYSSHYLLELICNSYKMSCMFIGLPIYLMSSPTIQYTNIREPTCLLFPTMPNI